MESLHLGLLMLLCLGAHVSSSEMLQRQKRNWIIDSFEMQENMTGPFPHSLGKITVDEKFTKFKITGQGVGEDPKDVFRIDTDTGEFTVWNPVDYERYKFLKLVFEAFNKDTGKTDTKLGVEVNIIDINDNPPVFTHLVSETSISETTKQGTVLLTVMANDDDGDLNGKFDFKILSVTPTPKDMEFYLTQIEGTQSGTISFRGCPDYAANRYAIIVEAKDRGKDVKLSSTCTLTVNVEDANNHLPKITGQTGPGKVEEGKGDVHVATLQVTDEDTPFTPAWNAKFHIEGDVENNFRITTDPKTNEGLLYVNKALNFEGGSLKPLRITVENEIPFHKCKVISRTSTAAGWEIQTLTLTASQSLAEREAYEKEGLILSTHQMSVTVTDVNEAAVFERSRIEVMLAENEAVGKYLATFKANDPDIASGNKCVYMKGEDPAGWVEVDRTTGKVTTLMSLDRESLHVVNNTYKVTVLAVDDGVPAMTSTATLTIHIKDENDNLPALNISTTDMCLSEEPTLNKITAYDLDEDPYSGPFHFKLVGEDADMWRLDSHHGYSTNLVKENVVHSGIHNLQLHISDRQHHSIVHNLTITVCECLSASVRNCQNSKASGSALGGPAIGILFLALLLLAALILLALLLSCEKEFIPVPTVPEQSKTDGNTEKLGTDCQVFFPGQDTQKTNDVIIQTDVTKGVGAGVGLGAAAGAIANSEYELELKRRNYMQWLQYQYQMKGFTEQDLEQWNLKYMGKSLDRYSTLRKSWRSTYSMKSEIAAHWEFLFKAINEKMYNLQVLEEELGDYEPHVYAEEEDKEARCELDPISIPEIPFDADFHQDLEYKFGGLVSVCMPQNVQEITYNGGGASSSVIENLQIQIENQETLRNTLRQPFSEFIVTGQDATLENLVGSTETFYEFHTTHTHL